jgi:hypothetical protein
LLLKKELKKKEKKLFEFFSFFYYTNERSSIRPWAIVFGSGVGRPLEKNFPSTKTTTGFAAGEYDRHLFILFNSINCYYYFF